MMNLQAKGMGDLIVFNSIVCTEFLSHSDAKFMLNVIEKSIEKKSNRSKKGDEDMEEDDDKEESKDEMSEEEEEEPPKSKKLSRANSLPIQQKKVAEKKAKAESGKKDKAAEKKNDKRK